MITAVKVNGQQDEERMQIRGHRLKTMRKRRGLSQRRLASMCKTSASQISMVENGDSRASLRTSIALADALATSIEYLVERVDDPRPMQEIVTELKTKAARVRDLEAGHAERLDPECADYVGVNEIDATVGAGATSTDGVFKRRHRFPHPWVREHGLKADLCRIIQVGGEAMEPTLPDGALILIDTAGTEHQDGRIYVLRIGEEVLARRLIHDPDAGWLVHSDNPDKTAWPTQPLRENTITVGEVRWLGRTFI